MYECMKAMQELFTDAENTERSDSIEQTRLRLIQHLDKQERRMLLEIVDGKDQLCEEQKLLHFLAGFCLATELHQEMDTYKKTWHMGGERIG